MGINEFLCALQSFNVKKDDISGVPLKIKYSYVAPYSTHQRHSTPTKYVDDEDGDDEEDVRQPSHKQQVHKDENIIFKLATRRKKLCSQAIRAQALHSLCFFNLLIKLSYTILFYFIHFILFTFLLF